MFMIQYLPEVVLVEGVRYASALPAEIAPPNRDDTRGELDKLRGSWVLVYWLYDGQEQSLSELKGVSMMRDDQPAADLSGVAREVRPTRDHVIRQLRTGCLDDAVPGVKKYEAVIGWVVDGANNTMP